MSRRSLPATASISRSLTKALPRGIGVGSHGVRGLDQEAPAEARARSVASLGEQRRRGAICRIWVSGPASRQQPASGQPGGPLGIESQQPARRAAQGSSRHREPAASAKGSPGVLSASRARGLRQHGHKPLEDGVGGLVEGERRRDSDDSEHLAAGAHPRLRAQPCHTTARAAMRGGAAQRDTGVAARRGAAACV
jgi:hypothetical protein